ncbi:S-antigen, N-terminal domain protein [Aspergillus ellipticus CBS 707.79]|uniref:S-antigen, N-terminal domain protein n=1 Tax=Aspergillus ellipticus CBS 707.79 TaxID=1448320 RepID=A0A319CWN8_9EURO|nr:S-antigen, N-terminal domain protein [Aspergillus ellipticus CBS 707.79]
MAASIITRGSSSLAAFTVRSRPTVDISLVDQKEGLVPSYTTGDTIEGTATVTVDHDTRFDELEITFEGTSRTSVERQSMPGRTGAYHTFLRLRQPLDETAYPTPRVLEAGRTYEFPFTFVIPGRLLPHICNHAKTNLHVEDSHTLLPPTLGDPMMATHRKSVVDDMTPEMCRISYLVRVTLLKKPAAQSASPITLASVGKKVRIIPAVDEEPPLNVADEESLYCLRKEKDVKRGFMRGKMGRLVVAAAQPKPVQLSAPGETNDSDSVNTVANVHLRFDPVGDELPPRLGTVWSKLRVSTFYSADPWGDYPSASCIRTWAQMGRGMYTEAVPLSTMCVASAQWTKHTATGVERRDSMQSTSSMESLPGPSASFGGSTYYTASVVVPITLPKAKTFVPTFYSCLTARIYALELSISYHAPNASILTPTASLRVPIQLTCQSRPGSQSKGTVVNITQDEVDAEFFIPRSVAPPVTELPLAPPEYTAVRTANLSPDRSQMLPSGAARVSV